MNHRDFRLLFDKTYMPLCMYALRITGNTQSADEAVQQVMTTAWERWRQGLVPLNPLAYLYTAVRNEALRLTCTFPAERVSPEDIEVSEECIDTSERDAALWEAIASLPPRCREVFLAAKRDGWSHKEIAESMGISTKTVEAQITKALNRLRDCLAPYASRRSRPFFLPFL